MKRSEYMDLLRYYLGELPKSVVDEIIEEYNLHFQEGLSHGKTEEQISEDLGSPKDIAHEYLNYESRKPKGSSNVKKGFFRDSGGKINWAVIVLIIVLSPVWGSLILAGGAIIFAAGFSVIALGASALAVGLAVLIGTFFPTASFIEVGPGLAMLSPVTRILSSLAILILGVLVINLLFNLIVFIKDKIKDKYQTYKWKRSRE